MKPPFSIKHGILWLILLVVLTGFLLIFSFNTSPLFPYDYGVDSGFYRYMGSIILKGKTPYTDLWEHKGPILYFIQALGAIHGTRNEKLSFIFLMQIFSLCLSAFFLRKADELISNGKGSFLRFLLLMFCALSVLGTTLDGGNLTEEWSIPMICCSFYLFTKYAIKSGSNVRHSRMYAFIHGICFGLIAFIRINNSISICAGLLVIGIYLIIKRQWKNLFENIIFGILGILTVVIPVFAFFYKRNALYEMLYGTFIFNLKYTDITDVVFSASAWFYQMTPLVLSAALILLSLLQTRQMRLIDVIVFTITSMNLVMLTKINRYIHYYIICFPVLLYTLILYIKPKKYFSILLTLVLFSFYFTNSKNLAAYYLRPDHMPLFSTANLYFPKSERDSTIAVDVPSEIYLNLGITPCSRFAAFQTRIFKLNPEFEKEFIQTMQEKDPKWIITPCSYDGIVPYVRELVNNQYSYQFNDGPYCFFRQTEQ